MDFLRNLFRNEKRTESVVFIDVATNSVAGAYAFFAEGDLPNLLYTRRLPIEIRKDESPEHALLRTLATLGDELIREGAPMLLRHAGRGNAGTIFVSVDTPWQETKVRTEHFERANPFTFTKSIVATALEKTSTIPPGKILVNESIISTLLNGYETRNPYGRKIHRALLVVLSSFIDEPVVSGIQKALHGLFHATNIHLIASSSLRYQAIRNAFPHERKPGASSFEQALAAANLGNLWLPGNPPRSIPVLPSHLAGMVRQSSAVSPDLHLLLMTLYYHHGISREKYNAHR